MVHFAPFAIATILSIILETSLEIKALFSGLNAIWVDLIQKGHTSHGRSDTEK
jgi:hypothetical protein